MKCTYPYCDCRGPCPQWPGDFEEPNITGTITPAPWFLALLLLAVAVILVCMVELFL